MGFDVSAGILIILGPTVWPLCMGQDFRLRMAADELANGPSPKKEMVIGEVKSVNLQYNTLDRWADETNDSATKHLMVQVSFFFHKILQYSLQKPFHFFFHFFYEITK